MLEEIRSLLQQIEEQLSEVDNQNDLLCNDMTLNHLKIANEWQKRKAKKPPDEKRCACCKEPAVHSRMGA